MQEMIKMRHIIDTWNVIDKYGIKGWVDVDYAILIPAAEYERLMADVKNQKYIRNITL